MPASSPAPVPEAAPAGRNLVLRVAAALVGVSLAACTPAGSAPGEPAAPEPLSYVAFGDSYASGLGAGSYSEECGRSDLGLPGLLDAGEAVDLTADATCAGAVASPSADGPSTVPGQVARLVEDGSLGPQTDLVTVSAGGNDVGFGEVAAACASAPLETCRLVIEDRKATAMPVLAENLDSLYGQLRTAAPEATVVVTGYPHLFSPEFGAGAPLSVPAQELFNAGTDALNEVIEDAAAGHGFLWVPTTQTFSGHGLGSPDAWITAPDREDGLHPNAEGYRSGYLQALRDSAGLAALEPEQPAG